MQNDGLIRDIKLIERYSRHNEDADWRFRSYLKASPMSGEELDKIVREKTDEVWAQIDCVKCANCCKTLKIVVDDADIRRLSTRLKITPKQFAAKYVETGPDPISGDKLFKYTPCAFLGDDNKCTVYADRPTACRDFPYLHTEGFRQRTIMMVQNTGTCPIVFNVWQQLKDRFWPRRDKRR